MIDERTMNWLVNFSFLDSQRRLGYDITCGCGIEEIPRLELVVVSKQSLHRRSAMEQWASSLDRPSIVYVCETGPNHDGMMVVAKESSSARSKQLNMIEADATHMEEDWFHSLIFPGDHFRL
jgi:hypothetical protein